MHKRFCWPADQILEDLFAGYEVRLAHAAWREMTGWIAANVVPLLGDAERIASMSVAAAQYGRRDADEELARLVIDAAARRRG